MLVRAKILVVAAPGNFRTSLVALLRAIPQIEITLADGDPQSLQMEIERATPDIVLLDGLDYYKKVFTRPGIVQDSCSKYVVLVDDARQLGTPRAYGVDCVLSRSISAGEFIATVKDLIVSLHSREAVAISWETAATALA